MIIWRGRRKPNQNKVGLDVGIVATSWVLEASWGCLFLEKQFEIMDEDEGEWKSSNNTDYFGVTITRRWSLGGDHCFYDGPHCSFSLGFIHLAWSYWWCDKCAEEGGVANLREKK